MMKFFTTLSFILFFRFPSPAQQKKAIAGKKIYTQKPLLKSTTKKTLNFSDLTTSGNVEKPFNFDGQWKGGFTDNSSGFIGYGNDNIDYVLELECSGSIVTGYSYTYFTGGPKRYYTICKLKGTLNKATKEIVVTESERTKYNTPPEFRNCFQTHKLKYSKDTGDVETLHGMWIPAPNQQGDCGFGETTLTRRLLKKIPLLSSSKALVATSQKNTPFSDMNRPAPQSVTVKQRSTLQNQNKKIVPNGKSPVAKNNNIAKNDTRIIDKIPLINSQPKEGNEIAPPKINFEKRINNLLKTIEIEQDTFRVQLYDNGEIDGDSVSVFFNGALLVSHKRLSDKPITLTLTLNKNVSDNELTMYAENLGAIPPNTALMIVTDGDKRYEVRITSDTERNGTIDFEHKPR